MADKTEGVLAVLVAEIVATENEGYSAAHLVYVRDRVAELLAAADVVRRGRHICRMEDSPDGEACGLCGHNWRDTSRHFIVGESAATDEARLDAAIRAMRGEPPVG